MEKNNSYLSFLITTQIFCFKATRQTVGWTLSDRQLDYIVKRIFINMRNVFFKKEFIFDHNHSVNKNINLRRSQRVLLKSKI